MILRNLFSRLSLRLLLLVLLSVAPAIGVVIHGGMVQRERALAAAEQQTLSLARSIVIRQHALMSEAHAYLGLLASDPELRAQLSQPGCGNALERMARIPGRFSDLIAVAPDGRVSCSMAAMPQKVSVADRTYFRRAVATRAFSIGDFQRSRITGRDTIFIAHPVFDDFGGVSAVLAAGLDLDWLRDHLSSAGLPTGSILTLVDANHTILLRIPDPEGFAGRKAPDLHQFPDFTSGVSSELTETLWLDGVHRLTHISPLYYGGGEGGIYIRMGVPRSAVLGGIESEFRGQVLLIALALGVVLTIGWFASEALVLRRVRDLTDTARRMGAGDLSARPQVVPDAGELGQLAQAFRDMAEKLQRREARIEHLATRDGLTALPNRRLLLDRTSQALVHAQRAEKRLALASINIDALKVVNDSLGHEAGDEVLLAVARRLCDSLHDEDTVARVEGDEFVVLFSEVGSKNKALVAANRLTDIFRSSFVVRGQSLHVTASVGVALFPDDGDTPDILLHYAQAAMHRAKGHGGNGVQFYALEMSLEAAERLRLEQFLRQALENSEFELHYQPKVSLTTGRIDGVEALLRWQQPDIGMVSPARFIPVAEETGIIIAIGEWVIRAACQQIRSWQEQGITPPVVAINISPRQFWQGDVVGALALALAETGVDARLIEVEVTETSIMRDDQQIAKTLAELRLMGVSVAIDDFGTGQSSLSQLRHLPLDKLKIDRSFVQGLGADDGSALLARQIIDIAHALRLRVVAEGVEEESELQFLLRNACDEVQGYYFSRPVAAAAMGEMLASGRQWTLPAIQPQLLPQLQTI